MCEQELLAIGTAVWVMTMGAILWIHVRAIYYPHPTLRSAATIRHLTDTIERLRTEMKRLEAERSELQTTVYTLSRQVQQLQRSWRSEPLQ